MNVDYKRKSQLIKVFEWISNKPIPVVSLHANVVVNINQLPDKNVITLFNLTTDPIPEVKLKYAAKHQMYFLNTSGELEKVYAYLNNRCFKG